MNRLITCWIACVVLLAATVFVRAQTPAPVKPPAPVPVAAPAPAPAPVDGWTTFLLSLTASLPALLAAVLAFIQGLKNGSRVAVLHGALADKLGLPDPTPAAAPAQDTLAQILARLDRLEKRP